MIGGIAVHGGRMETSSRDTGKDPRTDVGRAACPGFVPGFADDQRRDARPTPDNLPTSDEADLGIRSFWPVGDSKGHVGYEMVREVTDHAEKPSRVEQADRSLGHDNRKWRPFVIRRARSAGCSSAAP